MYSTFDHIRGWARDTGILSLGTVEGQTLKLMEEVGELARAQLREPEAIEDAIGDCVVVLTILAQMHRTSLEFCVNQAWNTIKSRKGQMRDGVFVKDEVEEPDGS